MHAQPLRHARAAAHLGDDRQGRADLHEARRALEGRGSQPPAGGPDRGVCPQPFRGLRPGLEERRRGALEGPGPPRPGRGKDAVRRRRLPRRPPRALRARAEGSRGVPPSSWPRRARTMSFATPSLPAGQEEHRRDDVQPVRRRRLPEVRRARGPHAARPARPPPERRRGRGARLPFLGARKGAARRRGRGRVHRRADQRRGPRRRPSLRHQPPAGGGAQGAGGLRRLRPCAPAHPHAAPRRPRRSCCSTSCGASCSYRARRSS